MNTIQFDKCIICLRTPNEFDKNSKLTIEHIVPEFIGGKLTVKNVCKACNSRLGGMLEGPLSKNFLFKCYSYFNGTKGKKNKLANPLAGTYSHPQGDIRFNDDFSIFKLPSYHFYEKNDGGLGFKVLVDIKDRNKIEDEVYKAITRLAARKGQTIKPDRLREQLKKIHSLAEENINIIEQPEIEVSLSIDFNMFALLAIKVAYEFIAYYFGNMVFNKEYDKFRESLYNCSLDPSIHYTNDNFALIFKSLLPQNPFMQLKDINEIDRIFSKNKTLVFLIKGCCSVRIINFWFNFQLPSSFSNVFLIFTSDSQTGEHHIFTEVDLYSI